MPTLARHTAHAKPSKAVAGQRHIGTRQINVTAHATSNKIAQNGGKTGNHCADNIPVNSAVAAATALNHFPDCSISVPPNFRSSEH
jgi:tagatose-1,6-bisphosphate aldolase non-catalytic subunit AgaZ/GatZ